MFWSLLWSCGGEKASDNDFEFELQPTDEVVDTADNQDTGTLDTGSPDTADTDVPEGALELFGEYEEPSGEVHAIDGETWVNSTGSYHISQYSNTEGWVVAQNDAQNQFNAEKWSTFDFFLDNGAILLCQTGFESATEADALLVQRADRNDLTNGCNGSFWRALRTKSPIRGQYVDTLNQQYSITAFVFRKNTEVVHVVYTDPTDQLIVGVNDQQSHPYPELWSAVYWMIQDTDIFLCQSSDQSASSSDATTPTVDSTDLETGCVGQAWTQVWSVSGR